MKLSTRNDLKRLAIAIESLAREVQNKIDLNTDILPTANELVRNNLTLVFALGEVSASELLNPQKKNSQRYSNYHRKRDDKTGRFVVKS